MVDEVRREFRGCQTERGTTVTPRRGRVALFYSSLPSSMERDYQAWHGACDVVKGEKWAANYVRRRYIDRALVASHPNPYLL